MIHKKGDVENVMSNYRPICSLPALYKLFSTILYGRLYQCLTKNKQKIRLDSKKTYQTTDHFATYRLIEQKCNEWRIKMWTATVDFTKSFDSISHKSIWEALKILQRRSRVRQPPQEDIQRLEGFGTDRRREQHFRHPERI